MIDPVQCQQLAELLSLFVSSGELTKDEQVCAKILSEAAAAIASGQDLTPPEAPPWKRRLLRHVSVSWFSPGATKPPQEPTEEPGGMQ